MPTEALQSIQSIGTEVGIGIAAISAIVYLVISMRKSHESEVKEMRDERKEIHEAFMSFVQTNNHQRTEIIQESTKAMVEAKNAMSKTSDSIQAHTEVLRDIREDLRRKQ
jgi:uncharacterized membrane protein (DUF106 family)